MPLVVSRDSLESKQVSLSGLVELCQNCTSYCLEKTERLLNNSSRAPRGWEKEYTEIADNRRKEDNARCLEACSALPRSCPSVDALRTLEQGNDKATNQKSAAPSRFSLFKSSGAEATPPVPVEVPTAQQLARCTHAAERFVSVLFAISQKPSKVAFDNVNPKTGEKMSDAPRDDVPLAGGNEGVATDMATIQKSLQTKKPGDKQIATEEILKRWSTSKRERLNMEELGVIRTEQEMKDYKQSLQRNEAELEARAKVAAASGVAGTVPKW